MVEAAGIELDWVRCCNSLMARDFRPNVFASQCLSRLIPIPRSLLQSSGFLHRLGDILETLPNWRDWPPSPRRMGPRRCFRPTLATVTIHPRLAASIASRRRRSGGEVCICPASSR